MKTISLKKVSAVAVASLGFGLLSVIPANAAAGDAAACTAWTVNTANKVTSISLATVTSSPATGAAVKVNMGGVLLTHGATNLVSNACSQQKFIGFLSDYPAGGFTNVTSTTATGAVAVAGATTDVAADTTAVAFRQTTGTDTSGTGGTVVSAASTTATASAGLGAFTFTPAKAGTYVLKVFNDSGTLNATPDTTEAVQTISITVADAPGYSAALSTVFIAEDLIDDNTGLATAATDAADKPLAIRTIGQKAAQIIVTTRNSKNAIYTGQTVTATISGSGFVSAGSTADGDADGVPTATEANAGDGSATTTRSAAVTAAANTTGIVTVGVWGDGQSGTGTVTITVTDQVSGATTTLATKTVTWYSGTAATLEVTPLQSIATPGVANGCSNATTCTQATLALTPAFVVVAKDSGGRVIPGLTITGTPTDTAVIASTSAAIVTGGDDKNGRGYYNFSVTGGAAANVGKKSVITFSTTLSDGVTKITTTSEATLGGTPATVTMSLDKATYTPGAPVVITITAKDSAGNIVGDGTYANLFAGNSTLGGAITGSTPGASVEIKGGVKTFTAFAPGTAGTYTVSNKFGTSMPAAQQGATISASIVVSDPNAGLLTQIDALNAKIVALNALIAKIMKKLGVK